MTSGLEKLYEETGIPAGAGRAVLGQDNTLKHDAFRRETGTAFTDEGLDTLFGGSQHYHIIKNEKPIHRWMLWLKVQGMDNKQVAAATGYTYVAVCIITKQDWFRRALTQTINEMGRAKAQEFIDKQEVACYETMVTLRDDSDAPHAVRLAAADKILDRIRGKAVVKQEIKTEATVDVAVHDAAALLRERADNERKLRANGIVAGTGSN